MMSFLLPLPAPAAARRCTRCPLQPATGSVGGGTTITIHGEDLIGNDTAGVTIYTGPSKCEVLWNTATSQTLQCRTEPAHWGGSEPM